MSSDAEPSGLFFRNLYSQLMSGEDDAIVPMLDAAIAGGLEEIEKSQHLGRRSPAPGRLHRSDKELARSHSLYALSRISDFLLEMGAPGVVQPDRSIARTPNVRFLEAHRNYFERVGLQAFGRRETFSPFHHEIVAVTQDESASNVSVEDVWWPGMKMNDLLLCRAGVSVRAPSSLIDRVTATSSTLWFTSRRVPRETQDWASGWGSNSQWRTQMPLFYEDSQGLHFNWEGKFDIADGTPSLSDLHLSPDSDDAGSVTTVDQRMELLMHRCYVRAGSPSNEPIPLPLEDRMTLPLRGMNG